MPRIAGLIACFTIAAACGCRRGSLEPMALQCKNKTVRIEIWQDGKQVPRFGDTYRLKPRPFVFRLHGNKACASYHASKDGFLEKELVKLDRPVVFSVGTGTAVIAHHLWLYKRDESPQRDEHFFDGDEKSFIKENFYEKSEARKVAVLLKKELDAVPFVSTYSHTIFPYESRSRFPQYYLENFKELEEGVIQGDYRIDLVGGKPIGQVSPVRLILFIRSPISDMFQRVKWKAVNLRFESD